MVDHQLGRQQGIDLLGVAAHARDGVAHRRQIRHAGTPVKSCSSTRAGMKAISDRVVGFRLPFRQRLDVRRAHEAAVLLAQQIFQQHAQRKRQLARVADAALLQRIQAIDFVAAAADRQRVARAK